MRKQAAMALVLAQLLAVVPAGLAASPHSGIVSGSQNTERTNRLTSEIRWHTSLAQAEGDARREGKLIFWVNMLGSLSGAT